MLHKYSIEFILSIKAVVRNPLLGKTRHKLNTSLAKENKICSPFFEFEFYEKWISLLVPLLTDCRIEHAFV